jgi:hypothetical protein
MWAFVTSTFREKHKDYAALLRLRNVRRAGGIVNECACRIGRSTCQQIEFVVFTAYNSADHLLHLATKAG